MRLDKSLIKSPPPPVSSLIYTAPPTISTIKQPLIISSERNPPLGTKTVSIDLTDEPPFSSSILATNTSSTSLSSPPPPVSPSCGKMRTKRHSTHYSHKKKDQEGEEPPLVPPSFLANPVRLTLPSSMTTIPLMGVPPSSKVLIHIQVHVYLLPSLRTFSGVPMITLMSPQREVTSSVPSKGGHL